MEKEKKVEEKVQIKQKRKILPDEEKQKRGRWIILLVFFISLFFSYVFSLKKH